MLSIKLEGIKNDFLSFGTTRPRIERRSPGPVANNLALSQINIYDLV